MIRLYKKVDGTKVELNGTGDLLEDNKQFLICLDETDDIVNLAINTFNENKVDVIGIDYQYEEGKIASRKEAIVDNLILQFLNGCESRANNFNFITSGKGTKIYKEIESILEDRLKQREYPEDRINDILSKMTLISVSSKEDTSDLKAQTISFVDVNDKNIETEFTDDYKNALSEQNTNRLFGHFGRENNLICVHNGSGTGDFKEYLKDKGFTSVLSYVLDKTRKDENKQSEDILKVLNECEEDIIGSKYKFDYVRPKTDIDIAVDAAKDITKLYKDEERIRKQREDLIDRLIANIREYSSETTYNQILMASGMFEWKDSDVLNAESDKQIRAYYDEIMNGNTENTIKNTK